MLLRWLLFEGPPGAAKTCRLCVWCCLLLAQKERESVPQSDMVLHPGHYKFILERWPEHLYSPEEPLHSNKLASHRCRHRGFALHKAAAPACHLTSYLGLLVLQCFAQMFAREMAADWTSWGNEVLKFQLTDRFRAGRGCENAIQDRLRPAGMDG